MDATPYKVPVDSIRTGTIGLLSVWLFVPLAMLHGDGPSSPGTSEDAIQAGNQPDDQAALDLTTLTNDQLLARFERAPFGSLSVSTGGGFESFVQTIGQVCRYAEIWETQHQRKMEQDATVLEMIRRGKNILPAIYARISQGELPQYIENPLGGWGSADLYGAYAYVIGQIGGRESATVLTGLLREAVEGIANFQPDGKAQQAPRFEMYATNTAFVTTHALWQLTGRRHAYSADEWERYLITLGDGFVPARERSNHVPDPAAVRQKVRSLVPDPIESREWLIAQGPAVVPQLMQALDDATTEHAVQIAWVIDELGATERMPAKLRRDYFLHRLSQLAGPATDELTPLDSLSRRRALEHLPFVDFVEIALEVNKQLPDAEGVSLSAWLIFHATPMLRVKFGTETVAELELRTPHSPWAGITPFEDPAAEITAAVPVLVDAITSDDLHRRRLGIQFAEMLLLCSSSKPAALVEPLREAWMSHHDQTAGQTMAQFRTPAATQAVLDGLQSRDRTVLTQAVSYLDELRLRPDDHAEVFVQVFEYTRHPLETLRRTAVISLRRCAPEMLLPELERLAHDPDQRIREECIEVLQRRPNGRLAHILLEIASNPDEVKNLRVSAVSALGDPEYRNHVDRMLVLLDDDNLQSDACRAIADAAGSDSLAVFYGVLQRGDDAGGCIYPYLERFADAKPVRTVESWQKWFTANPDMIPAR